MTYTITLEVPNKIEPGTEYGWLTVIKKTVPNKHARANYWLCKCRCGNMVTTVTHQLLKGKTKSCGCKKKLHHRIHGMHNSALYKAWSSMKSRCTPNRKKAHLYYKKGIKVCKKWQDFLGFVDDMGDSYEEGLSLDRIDSNKGYYKKNCRWVTTYIQSTNRPGVMFVSHGGTTLAVKTWCRLQGKSNYQYILALKRIKNGEDPKKVINLKDHEILDHNRNH